MVNVANAMVGPRSWIGGIFNRSGNKKNDKFQYPLSPLQVINVTNVLVVCVLCLIHWLYLCCIIPLVVWFVSVRKALPLVHEKALAPISGTVVLSALARYVSPSASRF